MIKYLRLMGFMVLNDLFAEHSWYFRNALVRANYNKHITAAYPTMEFLLKFLGNLLLGEKNILRNRDMRIRTGNDDSGGNPIQTTVIEQEIINYIAVSPQATQDQIAKAVNKSPRTVKTIMQGLQDKGFIKRKGSKKTGKWEKG